MIEELCAQLAESEAATEAATDKLDDANETLRELREAEDEAWGEIEDNPDLKRKAFDTLQEGIRAACDAAYEQGKADSAPEAPDLLRAYLVSLGLPADPVRLDDPHLDALARALL